MRAGYRAFLMGTATDLPCRGFKPDRKNSADELFQGIRKWGKVVSSVEH